MNALEMLQQYLARYQQPQADPMLEAIMRREQQAFGAMSPDLPANVQSSIYSNPSYAEGEMPPSPGNPALGQEVIQNMLSGSPQRDQYMMQQLLQANEVRRLQRLGLPFSGANSTQFASPLNQMISRPRAPGMNL